MSNSTQNDWAKEIQFNLENLIVDIGVQVTDDYKDKNGLYEGMSIKNVRSRDKYKKIFSKLLADARKEVMDKVGDMKTDKMLKSYWSESVTSSSYAGGYLQAIDDVLATLKEEESK